MPNWCETHITFFANEGGQEAIRHFHQCLLQAESIFSNIANIWRGRDLWLIDVARYYGVNVDTNQRGYFDFIQPDVTHDSFQVTVYDAWGPNIAFWNLLLSYFYGNKIGFLWQAAEPGMSIYVTNDPGLLPRYNLTVCADNIDQLLTLDKLFVKNGPFWAMGTDHEGDFSVYEGGWVSYRKDPSTDKYVKAFIEPSVNYYDYFEGDDDDCLGFLDDLTSVTQNAETLDDVQGLPIYINPYVYQSTEECTTGEVYGDLMLNHIVNHDKTTKDQLYEETAIRLEKPFITPIMDNKQLFVPLEGGEKCG